MRSRKFLSYGVRMGKRLPDIKYCEVPLPSSGVSPWHPGPIRVLEMEQPDSGRITLKAGNAREVKQRDRAALQRIRRRAGLSVDRGNRESGSQGARAVVSWGSSRIYPSAFLPVTQDDGIWIRCRALLLRRRAGKQFADLPPGQRFERQLHRLRKLLA